MAEIASVSRTDLQGRRKRLRRQRQKKIIQAIWQTITVSGIAGGLLWVAIQPYWVLKEPKQIEIAQGEDNHLLADDTIRSLLALRYPQSLLRIDPSAIALSLRSEPMIAQATVSRRLFPPGLIVQVKERLPVAIAQTPKVTNAINKKVSMGLLDANGVWIPLEKYISFNPKVKLPSLKVIGTPQHYRPYWTQVYQAVNLSAVKIMEIDFQDPTNIILQTELGKVHLGNFSSKLPEQIKVLAEMRYLPTQLNSSHIEYIDLKNPDSPLVQMNQKNQELNRKLPEKD
jgi:cell division protein FtsQ